MDWTILYAILMGGAVTIIIAYRLTIMLTRQASYLYYHLIRKRICYKPLVLRRRGTTDVSVLAALTLCLYLAANALCITMGVSDNAAMNQRARLLFAINLVPLFLGGRTSIIADKILKVGKLEVDLAHRWIGRVAAIEGVAHAALEISLHTPSSKIGPALLAVLISMATLSLYFVRRRIFELFLKLHFASAAVLLTLLWLHSGFSKTPETLCLLLASVFWSLQHVLWILFLAWRNLGVRPQKLDIRFVGNNNDNMDTQAAQVWITLKRPWKVQPGQYVYLSIPRLARQSYGLIQSHPYLICWVPDVDGKKPSTIVLLIESRKGFSNDIRLLHDRGSLLIDGPYGVCSSLDSYDKILFLANGIGVSAHLLAIKHLIQAHDQQKARVRRLSLVWLIEAPEQEHWIEEFLRDLIDQDSRCILTIVLYIPYSNSSADPKVEKSASASRRLFKAECSLDIPWTLAKECNAEAGNMAVSVCGTPGFEKAVMLAVSTSKHTIAVYRSAFQPEYTDTGKKSKPRYLLVDGNKKWGKNVAF